MKRHIFEKLEAWKNNSRRKPLILMGVRQCGKTYVLEAFGKSHFPKCHLINFEEQREVHQCFEKNLTPSQIINNLEFTLNKKIDISRDLIIFDEIQACPAALTSLKYFAEKMPQLALTAAGSLLGLNLNNGSFPVGKVEFLDLYPLSFSEFLQALDERLLFDYCQSIDWHQATPITAHEHLWQRLKMYFVTGGLPEVVQILVDNQENLFTATQLVREKQQSLIKSYYADIAKHAGKQNAMHIERIFESIPRQLSRTQDSSAPRFQFRDVVPGIQHYQRLSGAIDWLNKAGLLIKTSIINHIEMPLNAFVKQSLFKLYCFDIGILGAMNQIPPADILRYDFDSYKGYFAENFVAQSLLAQGKSLYCWQANRAEIEFITYIKDRITPIEVKAGHIIKAKSLQKYQELFNPGMAFILSANPYIPTVNESTKKIALYLVEWIENYSSRT